MKKYQALREEVRAFCPNSTAEKCKGKALLESYDRINGQMDAFYRENPQSSAMQLRKKFYEIASNEIEVTLFRNAPFYFELGTNGGWFNCPNRWMSLHLKDAVLQKEVPPAALEIYQNRLEERFFLSCGPFVDSIHHLPSYTKILQNGISGIHKEVREELAKDRTEEERIFLETAAAGLEAIHKIQLKFHEKACQLLREGGLSGEQRKFMQMAADASLRAPWEAPKTFFEGLNLLCFVREAFGLLDSLAVYSLGHPDRMLYDLYLADLAAGRLTKEEAYDLICRFMVISDCHYDGMKIVTMYGDHELEQPLTLGGCDRDGKPIFNELTRMILKGHRENDLVFPKLHCRIGKDSPEEYYDQIAQDVWNSRCVHTLFNDDVILEGIVKQGHSLADARRYVCCGCWDGFVDGNENADVANYFSLARILEAAIYQDPGQTEKFGFAFEALDDCTSIEEFRERLCRNFVNFLRCILDDFTEYGKLFAKISPHPAYSAGLAGCIANGKDDTAGGGTNSSRVIVLAFLANVVDSILAVKRVCFEQKLCTLKEFLDVVRNNWEGREDLRQEAMRASYWGDDKEESREMGKYILDRIMASVEGLQNERGGKYLFSIWIYREFRYWGEKMRALPDGRRNGEPLALALNPSDFRNKEELTTTINAMTALDYTQFVSSNLNFTFGKEKVSKDILKAVFKTFIEKRLQLLQPNCFSRKELEDAMVDPEKHRGLIVKVCGFSARFVALEPAWQKIILNRYNY